METWARCCVCGTEATKTEDNDQFCAIHSASDCADCATGHCDEHSVYETAEAAALRDDQEAEAAARHALWAASDEQYHAHNLVGWYWAPQSKTFKRTVTA